MSIGNAVTEDEYFLSIKTMLKTALDVDKISWAIEKDILTISYINRQETAKNLWTIPSE